MLSADATGLKANWICKFEKALPTQPSNHTPERGPTETQTQAHTKPCIWMCTAATAKSLQSCLTLCDPIDGLNVYNYLKLSKTRNNLNVFKRWVPTKEYYSVMKNTRMLLYLTWMNLKCILRWKTSSKLQTDAIFRTFKKSTTRGREHTSGASRGWSLGRAYP